MKSQLLTLMFLGFETGETKGEPPRSGRLRYLKKKRMGEDGIDVNISTCSFF